MKHFKGMLYQIVSIAIHSETSEEYVVYQALYGDYKTYVRPLAMFLSEVDHEKYPEVTQKYRFEVYKPENASEKAIEIKNAIEIAEDKEVVKKIQETDDIDEMKKESSENLENTIDVQQALLDFLDARSYKDKLEQLEQMKKNIDSHIVNSMAISLDLLLVTETVEEQLEEIRNCLLTHMRFEDRRLR